MLRFKSVSVYLDDAVHGRFVQALDGVTFSLSKGEAIALIGSNGAGKSTLLHAAAGLLSGIEGEIVVNGLPVVAARRKRLAKKERHALRAVVGVALQWPERGFVATKVYDEIAFTCLRLGWARHEVDGAVHCALERVGLASAYLDRSLYTLSGGERRRVAIAAALAHRPLILLLDEPEAGLDLNAAQAVARCVRRFVDDGGAALVVTHDVEAALAWADKFLLLEGGRLTGEWQTKALFQGQGWDTFGPWLWDGGAFGRAHARIVGAGVDLPSPYVFPREYLDHLITVMERAGK